MLLLYYIALSLFFTSYHLHHCLIGLARLSYSRFPWDTSSVRLPLTYSSVSVDPQNVKTGFPSRRVQIAESPPCRGKVRESGGACGYTSWGIRTFFFSRSFFFFFFHPSFKFLTFLSVTLVLYPLDRFFKTARAGSWVHPVFSFHSDYIHICFYWAVEVDGWGVAWCFLVFFAEVKG